MAETVRIAIVDDHPFFRDGVRRALQKAKHISVVAEGASAADALQIASEHTPNLMLIDITMPGSGIDAVRDIQVRHPDIKIVMLTGSDDDEHLTAALAAGAAGYLLKGTDTAELLDAVRAVLDNQAYITPALSMRVLLDSVRSQGAAARGAVRSPLTRREGEILDAAVRGLNNIEIAAELKIAVPTVKNTLSRIFEKLKVRNRREAIAIRLQNK